MVIPFSTGHLAFLRGVQESAMQDECVHEVLTKVKNSMGEREKVWMDGSTYSAGLHTGKSRELSTEVRGAKSEAPVTKTDAAARLPVSAFGTVKQGDQLRFTKRDGENLSPPLTFRVVGVPERGPTGLVVGLSWLGPVEIPTP